MTSIDNLNTVCSEYARELTDKWIFTGWKPGQGNIRLHAQWLRADEYEGERYYSTLQCLPLDDWDDVDKAKENMKTSLEDVTLFTRLAPQPLAWK